MATTDRPTPPGPAIDSPAPPSGQHAPRDPAPPGAPAQPASNTSTPATTPAPRRTPSDPASPPERIAVGTGWFWSLIVGVVLALAVVIFVLQNSDPILVEFLGWQGEVSLAGLVLVVALAAIVLDELFGALYRRRRRRRLNASLTDGAGVTRAGRRART
jgi:uncharacterized integral membrane protein